MDRKNIYEYYLHEWNPKQKKFLEPKKIEKNTEEKGGEEVAEKYYSVQFEVFNIEPSDSLSDLPLHIKEKVKEHPLVLDTIPAGFPDLVLYDREAETIAYCEVKLNSDGLRFKQLKFIEKASKPVSVAFIQEEKYQEKLQVRCSVCGATFDNQENLEQHSCSIGDEVGRMMNWEGYGFN